MSEIFTPWDSAEYLASEVDMALYLDACVNEAGDDPAFIAMALETIARATERHRPDRQPPSQ
ncbi:transcriptional regulator [Pseudomonas sp. App30]|uniref:helix-turn-helix domain-containing transcriptional regulator n=1 Tax=Pseudomonas sp. App30 TaxID=3068990 RepID=UPI003A8048D1